MIIAVLLIIYAIVFILALLYILGCLVSKHLLSRRKKYQEHIDSMVNELFPPSSIQTPVITAVQTPAVNTYTPTPNESHDPQYQEAKRIMVANVRRYFNRRKMDAAIRDTEIAIRETEIKTGLTLHSPMFSSRPDISPPSLQRILE